MLLRLQLRRSGSVAVFQCEGPIISGSDAEHLEKTIDLELTEGNKDLVLDVGSVPRVDSSGLGLMVRLLVRARKAGGDLKVAAPPGFFTNLLEMTRLSALFEVFSSSQEAVMSYRNSTAPVLQSASPKARIVFFDRSSDICAFVRTVLTAHGYEVQSTSLINDAKTLLKCGKIDLLIIGPNTSPAVFSGPSAVVSLAAAARPAPVIELGKDFHALDAEHAGAALLHLISAKMDELPAQASD